MGTRESGHPLGLHRVLDKTTRLPQSAEKLDNTLPIFDNEILIDVESLNIDAASFVQMEKETGGDVQAIAKLVVENTKSFGKQHNQVTGSGGLLVGKVREIGTRYKGNAKFKVGDEVATLVSLTLTPLHIEEVLEVRKAQHQLKIKGHAVLFESGIAAKLPTDLKQSVAMAVLDVAGAPAYADQLCKKGDTLVVLGAGGKAGLLCCAAGRKVVGESGKVIGIEPHPPAANALKELSFCDEVLVLDAQDGLAVRSGVESATHGKMGDVVINVVSAPQTEMASILSASPSAQIVFFSMATRFTQVALGAEGVASSAKLYIGNGYSPGHADFAIELLRCQPKLLELFEKRYG